jgi:hypothetical protein
MVVHHHDAGRVHHNADRAVEARVGARPVLVAACVFAPFEEGQEPRGREHSDGVPRAGQAGAVGQHKEAAGDAQAGDGDGGHGGVEDGTLARLAAGAPLIGCLSEVISRISAKEHLLFSSRIAALEPKKTAQT